MAKQAKKQVESVFVTLATGTKVTGPKEAVAKVEKRAKVEAEQNAAKASAKK